MSEEKKKVYYDQFPEINETPETIEATIDGREVSVPAIPGKSIVESLIAAGANPIYSCLHGSCMSCMVELVSGEVGQEGGTVLDQESLDRNEFLSCQAKPLSKKIRVNFDIC